MTQCGRRLERPYDDQYKGSRRSEEFLAVDIKRHGDTISVDRLKHTYLEGNPMDLETVVQLNPQVNENPPDIEEVPNTSQATGAPNATRNKTSFGRNVRFS